MKATFIMIFMLLISSVSCTNGDKEINIYKADKKFWNDSPLKGASNDTPVKKVKFKWVTPKTWEEKEGSSIRIGSFSLFSKDKKETADMSIISLMGNGGGLIPNINRWRGQVGLDVASAQAIQKEVSTVKAKLGSFKFTYIQNKKSGQGILVGFFTGDSRTLFVKAQGPLSVLSNNKKTFKKFLGSIYVP